MRSYCFVGSLCLLLAGTLSHAKGTPRMKVTVIDNLPTTFSYDWQVAGKDTISCYSSGCTSYFRPSNSGTASVNGAVLKLLLPDGRIVIAECSAKPDVAANWAAALTGAQASTVYRDCRRPEANSTIEAEFNQSQVKLFMQAPSIDGTGRKSSETYDITGVLQPNAAPPAPPTVTVTVNNILPSLKTFSYPEDGFSVAFPFEPHLTKIDRLDLGDSIQSHMYFAQNVQTGLVVIADYHTVSAKPIVPATELQSEQSDFLKSATSRLLREKEIVFNNYSGVEFEAESDQLHTFARFYVVGTTIYKTVVFTIPGKTYADSARFLDSFQLLAHQNSSIK